MKTRSNLPKALVGLSTLALFTGCASNTGSTSTDSASSATAIKVSPNVDRQIEGVAEIERKAYFSICDHGTEFRERCRSDERFEELLDLQINFGRHLGPVQGAVKWRNAVREDPNRPGYADLDYLKQQLQKDVKDPDPKMVETFGKLDIAAHGNHNSYPDFMEKYATKQAQVGPHQESIPANVEAAAELAAHVMAYGYNDFDRPTYFEPLNEPHWSYYGDQQLADWHVGTMEKVHELAPGVKVGGPCQPVSYMYANAYGTFRGFASFIDATEGKMDFYSFHCYDYFRPGDGDFGGRVTSGLPLESVLDMIPNYTLNNYGKIYDIVISEHGGYESGAKFTTELAKKHIPGEGFEWEMKKRSIADFNAINTMIANTLAFMNHPHTVKKAVPFTLLESMAWDPTYYSTLYAPRDFKDKTDWVASQRHLFYKFFKDVQGRYVKIENNDPDVQALALANDNTLYVVLNNLANEETALDLSIKAGADMNIRRFGRNADFTPYYSEQALSSLKDITLVGRESILLKIAYKKAIRTQETINERAFYSDKVAVAVPQDGETFTIQMPEGADVDYAQLRVGFCRAFDAPKEVVVLLNGEQLKVPMEDSADRLVQPDKEFATTRLIPVDPAKLLADNTVKVIFPDGGAGSVGSVVIRAGLK
ncbi:hypothetical protein [Coraliomargarita akajimensis]|nr:hypothetical protein [Coraliomargarita akajimensis]